MDTEGLEIMRRARLLIGQMDQHVETAFSKAEDNHRREHHRASVKQHQAQQQASKESLAARNEMKRARARHKVQQRRGTWADETGMITHLRHAQATIRRDVNQNYKRLGYAPPSTAQAHPQHGQGQGRSQAAVRRAGGEGGGEGGSVLDPTSKKMLQRARMLAQEATEHAQEASVRHTGGRGTAEPHHKHFHPPARRK